MANMSYCRFQNTLSDLRDCARALEEGEPLSDDEQRARNRLVELCAEIVSSFAEEAGGYPGETDPEFGRNS